MMNSRVIPAELQRTLTNSNTFKNKINLDTLLVNSNATLIGPKNIKGYGCVFCREKFLEPSDLKKHSIKEHSNSDFIQRYTTKLLNYTLKLDITELYCKICENSIPKLTDLMAHLKTDHNKELFADFKSQIVPFKFETKLMTCVVCGQEFTSFKLLQEHMSCHFSNYVCEICGVGFITEKLKSGHLRIHEDSGRFECNDCDKTFCSKQKLRLHSRRCHIWNGKINKCCLCEERFVDYWRKIDHLVKVHGLPAEDYRCQACNQTFNDRRTLVRHTKRDHLLDRKHECTECDMKFFDRRNLQEHMFKHNNTQAKLQCEVCSKNYSRRSSLKEHLKKHSGVKRFNCKHCDLGFVRRSTLKTHMQKQHDEDILKECDGCVL